MSGFQYSRRDRNIVVFEIKEMKIIKVDSVILDMYIDMHHIIVGGI